MLYKIIETDFLCIQVNRFVSVFTQGVAFTALKLNLSLSSIAQLYSLSFVVFQFLIFTVILKLLKSKWIALGLLLFNILMIKHTFYWTASELIQGMAVLFLFVAAIQKSIQTEGAKKYLYHALAIFSLITCAFAHPLLNIPLVYTTLFFLLKYPRQRTTSILYLIMIVGLYIIKQLYFNNYYDVSHMKGLDNFAKYYPNYYTPSLAKFFGWLVKDYYLFLASAIFVTSYYLKKSQYLKLILMITFLVAYSLLINVCYPKDAYQFYLESQYLPLSFFVILPLVLDILPSVLENKWSVYLISILILLGILGIHVSHKQYSKRLDWNRAFMNKNIEAGRDKIIVDDAELDKETMMLTWAMAYELWIMSTIEKSKTVSAVALRNPKKFDDSLHVKHMFLTMWINNEYEDLNKDYFKFEDGERLYKKYSMDEINEGVVK